VAQESHLSRVTSSEKIDVRSDIGEFAQETCPIPPLKLADVVLREGMTEKKPGSGSFKMGSTGLPSDAPMTHLEKILA
jgi:hypothetical protein